MFDELCIKASELAVKISDVKKKVEAMPPGLERAQTKGWIKAWKQEHERVMVDISRDARRIRRSMRLFSGRFGCSSASGHGESDIRMGGWSHTG